MRPIHQGPRDCNPLALTARELVRSVIHPVTETHTHHGILCHFIHDLWCARMIVAGSIDERHLDVSERRHSRKQVKALKNESNVLISSLRALIVSE